MEQPFAGPPVVVGHRGAPRAAPENTPASFTAAARAGATWVELDARRSADGRVVVRHDPVAPGGEPVVALTAAELRGEGIWTLADVLTGLPAGLGVDVELKNLPGEPDYDEQQVLARMVVGVLDGSDRPLVVTSFNPLTVEALRAEAPDVPAGLLTTPGLRAPAAVATATELDAQVWCPHVDTPGLDDALGLAHGSGLGVLVWTVNDLTRARDLARSGADALCTDDPAAVAAALRQTSG